MCWVRVCLGVIKKTGYRPGGVGRGGGSGWRPRTRIGELVLKWRATVNTSKANLRSLLDGLDVHAAGVDVGARDLNLPASTRLSSKAARTQQWHIDAPPVQQWASRGHAAGVAESEQPERVDS